MKTIRTFLLRLLLLAVVVVAVICGLRYWRGKPVIGTLFGFSVSHPMNADPTPMRVEAVREIGQWEFLSIDDEEIVDTIRRHWLSTDDRLVRIYRGTLRIGIDFNQCADDWAMAYGDTVRIRLPKVHLLDNLFIDEARVRSFYEHGNWDASTRADMLRRAEAAMRRRCLTPDNMRIAEESARKQLTDFFHSLGYASVFFDDEKEKH